MYSTLKTISTSLRLNGKQIMRLVQGVDQISNQLNKIIKSNCDVKAHIREEFRRNSELKKNRKAGRLLKKSKKSKKDKKVSKKTKKRIEELRQLIHVRKENLIFRHTKLNRTERRQGGQIRL